MHVGGCGGRKVAASRRQAAPSPCPAPQNARTWTMGEPVSRLTHLALLLLLLAALLGHLPQVRSRTAPLPPPPVVFAPRSSAGASHLTVQSADESRRAFQTARRRWLSGSGSAANSPTPVDAWRGGMASDRQVAQDATPVLGQHHVFQKLIPEGFDPLPFSPAAQQESHNKPVRHPWNAPRHSRPQAPGHRTPPTSRPGRRGHGSLTSTGTVEVDAQLTVQVPTAGLMPFRIRPHLPLEEDLRKTLASRSVSPSPAVTSGLIVVDFVVVDSDPHNSTISLTVRGQPDVIRQLVSSGRSGLVVSQVTGGERRSTPEEREEEKREDSETLPSRNRGRRSIRHMGMSYGMNGRIRTQMLAHRLSISYRHVQPCAYADRFYCMNGGTCVFVGALDIKTCRCPIGYTGVRCELIDQEYILSLLTDSIIFS